MRRVIVLATLLLTAALGTTAEAKCRMCVESISAQTNDGNAGGGKQITLRVAARSTDGGALPATATAVVMQVDGDRSKCITVALYRGDTSGGLVAYAGTFTAYGQTVHSGRLDIGGDVFDFTVPLNGAAGTVTLVGVAPPATAAPVPRTIVVPATAPQPAVPAATAVPASAAAPVFDLSVPDRQGMLLAFAVILFIAASVYVERRQAKARREGSAADA
ncbi:MAG TPA: hypothetical protein VFW12_00145 [Candidatus Limnocylindria bacterium]|nr:hypothetical protein [Candidatus Limnocylindria bacterium]